MLGCIYPTNTCFSVSEMISNLLSNSYRYRDIWLRNYECTELGYAINKLNLAPNLSKLLIECSKEGILLEGIQMCSCLSIAEICDGKMQSDIGRNNYGDHIQKLMIINGFWQYASQFQSVPLKQLVSEYSDTHKLISKNMKEMMELCKYIIKLLSPYYQIDMR